MVTSGAQGGVAFGVALREAEQKFEADRRRLLHSRRA